MSEILNNIKLQLRKDNLSNWQNADPVLKDGEIAIVKCEYIDKIKVGNGISSFNELPYFSEQFFETKELKAQSVAQGMYTKASPTSLATGIFTEASANFGIVHGIEACILSTDNYAFVFNGVNLEGINDRYTSHGEGTFNINPTNGINGLYIGESNLSSIISTYITSADLSLSYDASQKKINLSAFNESIGSIDCTTFIKDGMLSDAYLEENKLILVFNTDAGKTPISVDLTSFVDDYSQQITELSNSISTLSDDIKDLQDNKLDADDLIPVYEELLSPNEVKLYKGPGNKDISLSVGTGSQLCIYTATLADFYLNSETSSSIQLENKFNQIYNTYSLKTVFRDWST